MALSTDITLPKEVKAKFPDKCIVCQEKPDSTIKITQNSSNPLLAFFMPLLMLFNLSRLEVPICISCKKRFLFQRWSRQIISFVVAMIAIFLITPYFSDWSELTRKLAVGGIVLLIIMPIIILEVIWPRIFDITTRKNSVDYEFSDSDYGLEFYELNKENVIKLDLNDET